MRTRPYVLSLCRILLLLFALATALPSQAQTLTKLFDFGKNGASPQYTNLILDAVGSAYGMTQYGGANGIGLIFKLKPDGTFYDLHDFTGSSTVPVDGSQPQGSLTLSGDGKTLYGMTLNGGASNKGIVFSLPAAGGTLTNLHSFAGGATDGSGPSGSLTLSGTTLYGMTRFGGSGGIVFSVSTTGTNFTTQHNFGPNGTNVEGAYPQSNLVSDGTTGFYLTTIAGGLTNDGALYDLVTTSTTAATLTKKVDFLASTTGRLPSGLAQNGSTYYGVTEGGNPGQFFTYAQGATSVTPYSFGGLGTHPIAPPTFEDSTHVIIPTLEGGTSSLGALLNFNPTTFALTTLHNFRGVVDGAGPSGAAVPAFGGRLGVTRNGGFYGLGTLYFNTGGVTLYHTFGTGSTDGTLPLGSVAYDSSGTAYGMTSSDGTNHAGTIWSLNSNFGTLTYTVLHPFPTLTGGINSDGATPVAGLTLSADKTTLYGVCSKGGTFGQGTAFKYVIAKKAFTRLYSFGGVFGNPATLFDGGGPAGPLTYTTINGTPTLLGTTSYGGLYGQGTAFSLTGF